METRRYRPMRVEATEERRPAVPHRGSRTPISAEALDESLKNVLSNNTTVGGRSLEGVHPVANVDRVQRLEYVSQRHISSSGLVVIADGVEIVNENLLKGNTEVKKVILPKSVRVIGRSAFEGCTSLEEVELPPRLMRIDMYAFKDCTSLTDVYIPGSVDTVNEGAFYGCTRLVDLEIGCGVRRLEKLCFANCKSLRNFRKRNLPKSVEQAIMIDGLWKSTWEACFIGCPCARTLFGEKKNEFMRQYGLA